jgi:hypothetical protein
MTSRPASAAKTLACPGCGGRFAVETLGEELHCPYCGAATRLSAQGLSSLDRYEEAVTGHLARADEELHHVAAWSHAETSYSWKSARWPLAIFLGLPTLLSLAMAGLAQGGQLAPENMGRFSIGMTVALNVAALAWVARSFIARSRVRGQRAQAGASRIACPGCGAPGQLAAGQKSSNCGHCGGSLIPGRTLIASGLDAARAAQRRATIARHRAERSGMLKLMNYSKSAQWIPMVTMGPMGLGLVAALFWASAQMAEGKMRYNPGIYIGWGLFAAFVAVLAIWFWLRRSRREEIDLAVDSLAIQLSGDSSPTPELLVAWLNSFWPAAYKTSYINGGPYYRCIQGQVHAFPVLIDFNPTATDTYRGARLHLFVAAEFGEAAASVSDANRHRANILERAIEHEGFDLRRVEAGLLIMAQPETVRALRDTPAALAAIVPELARATELLAGLGASPAQRIAD